jgi:hypothetical protein
MSETTGIIEEAPGVKSSKRFAGIALVGLGAGLLLALGIIAMFRVETMTNATIAITAGTTLVGIGAGLLGVTVLEGIGQKIGGGA